MYEYRRKIVYYRSRQSCIMHENHWWSGQVLGRPVRLQYSTVRSTSTTVVWVCIFTVLCKFSYTHITNGRTLLFMACAKCFPVRQYANLTIELYSFIWYTYDYKRIVRIRPDKDHFCAVLYTQLFRTVPYVVRVLVPCSIFFCWRPY